MAADPLDAGAQRFSGFADLYDDVRPVPPHRLGVLLSGYVGGPPSLVVDLGSGTGLSTRWAETWAGESVGIEPSDDMRRVAEEIGGPGVTYRPGWSHATGLPDDCADVVMACQALHWMDPEPTFAEAARLLRPGGMFAAIDCDWPPVIGDPVVEQAWDDARRRMRVFEARLAAGLSGDELRADPDVDDTGAGYSGLDAHHDRTLAEGVRSWSKSGHLDRMVASGRFAWCRELALTSDTTGDVRRLVGLLRSQGDHQTLRRHGLTDAELGVERMEDLATRRWGVDHRPWHFVYRARIGLTPT